MGRRVLLTALASILMFGVGLYVNAATSAGHPTGPPTLQCRGTDSPVIETRRSILTLRDGVVPGGRGKPRDALSDFLHLGKIDHDANSFMERPLGANWKAYVLQSAGLTRMIVHVERFGAFWIGTGGSACAS
jgi:hypothetical protein